MNFKELLSEGTKGQINITKSENDGKEAEQLSIDDILDTLRFFILDCIFRLVVFVNLVIGESVLFS